MKQICLLLVGMVMLSAFSQTSKEIIPEIAHQFSKGKANDQLGMLNGYAEDSFYAAGGLTTDGDDFYILDHINSRILVLTDQFKYKGEFPGAHLIPVANIWLDSDYLVGGIAGEPDESRYMFYIARRTTENGMVPLRLSQFLKDYDRFDFLCHVENVLVFQDEFGKYFGIDIAGVASGKEAKLVSEDDLRERLLKLHDERYSFKDGLLFYNNILLSRASSSAYGFMSSLSSFDAKAYSYLSDARFIPLPNGRFLYSDFREIWIFDTNGKLMRYAIFPNNPEYYRGSDFTPSPDGYIYYLHADFKNKQTIVYRLGPYPELKLDYGGTGGTINDDHVNIRENPTTKSAVLSQVNKGTPTRVLDKTDKPETIGGQTAVWYKVRLWDRTEGWVFGAFLDVAK